MSEQARGGFRSPAATAFAAVVAAMLVVVGFLLGCVYLGCPCAFNSDHLYPSALCRDLRLGRPLAGWYVPGAPYLFPDVLLLVPCQLLPGGLAGEFIGWNFALLGCFLGSVVGLGRAVGLARRPAFVAAGCGVLLFVAVHLGKAYESRATHLASPGSHFGIIPVGLALLALTAGLLRRGPRPLPVLLFLAFGTLGAFSDKLLVVQFLAALAGTLLLLTVLRLVTVRQFAGMAGLIGAAYLLSVGLRLLLLRLGVHLLAIEQTFGNVKLAQLKALLGQVIDGVRGQPLLAALMVLYAPAVLLVLGTWLRRKAGEPAEAGTLDRRGVLLAVLTLGLVPVCNLGALFATGLSENSAVYRYILPCYTLPPLLTGWLLTLLPAAGARLGRVVFPALAVSFAAWQVADRGRELMAVKLETPYPPLAQALDRLVRERGPMRGLGEFWCSRQCQFLTHERVIVAPLDRFGTPFFHAGQRGQFLADDPREAAVPPFRFVVVHPNLIFQDPGPAMITLHYGLPRERIPAGEHEIWLYDRLQSTPLDRFFRSLLAERLRARDPGVGPADPACLARPKANMTPLEDRDVVTVAAGQTRAIRFEKPVTGKVLDVGAGTDELFDLAFFAGAEQVGLLHVPAVPFTGASYEYPGIQSRLLDLPAGLRSGPWDRVVVRPRPGTKVVHLGHLLVRADEVPDTGVAPSRRIPHVRLEAEWLPTFTTFADDSLTASTPDPEASGGRVRQAAADFQGVVSFNSGLSLPAGRYRLDFAVRTDGPAVTGEIATTDVLSFALHAVLASRTLTGGDFPEAGRFVTHSLTLDLPGDSDNLVFRLESKGKTAIALDYIDVVALPADASAAR
jgi:hypothetical protein